MPTAADLRARLKTEALARLRAGEATKDVAVYAGVNVSTVQRWARAAGVKLKPANPHRRHDPNTYATVMAALAAGETQAAAGASAGVSLRTVAKWAAAASVTSERARKRAAYERAFLEDPAASSASLAARVGVPTSTARGWHRALVAREDSASLVFTGRWVRRGAIFVPAPPEKKKAA